MKLIADNVRITRPDIAQALAKKDPLPIQQLVEKCEEKNPWAIDVNTGPLGRSPHEGMRFFVDAVQAVTPLPLLIDTSSPQAMAAGLDAAKNPVIINGFSLEPRKLDHILPLAASYDIDIVGFLLYPDSRVPKNAEQRFEIALELFEAAYKAGVAKERIIIDPVVPPLAWEDGIFQARQVLETIRTLPDLLGFPVRTIGGISNLATNAPDKKRKALITNVYMAMLAGAGLDFALMNILDDTFVNTALTAGVLATEDLFAWEMLPGS